jgi:hypothetical protein
MLGWRPNGYSLAILKRQCLGRIGLLFRLIHETARDVNIISPLFRQPKREIPSKIS